MSQLLSNILCDLVSEPFVMSQRHCTTYVPYKGSQVSELPRQYFAEQMRLGHKPSRAYGALANRWAAIVWKMLQERERFNQSRLDKSQIKALSAV